MKAEKNNIILISLIILLVLGVFYIAISNYFEGHFYYGTRINNIDVSADNVDEVKETFKKNISDYKLTLKERDKPDEEICASDINLTFINDEKIEELKKNQNGFKWILNIGKTNELIADLVSYDDKMLKEKLGKLNAASNDNTIESKNPTFEYENGEYKIIDEVKGNKLVMNSLYENTVFSIMDGKTELDLDENNCYEQPEYTSTSEKVLDTKDLLNKYVQTNITYNLNEDKEVVDGSIIKEWLEISDDYTVKINDKKINEYLKTLAEKYNTVGKTRNFNTTNGSNIKVSGGDYGWKIDTKGEKEYLLNAVLSGTIESKDIQYSQKAFNKEDDSIGNTYVEISIPSQHLWFYKNGQLIIQSDVVTGNVSAGHGTPQGIYKLDYKERNATLKGENYSTPVSFWMPFNGGIGIHDATWRGNFGGSIYLTSGSHGCVNAPYGTANTIFNNIEAGTPVVCYY